MKSFEEFLTEAPSNAKRQALEMGLKYRGFGYWEEPKTGKVRFKTVDGELKPIDKEEQEQLDDKENIDTDSIHSQIEDEEEEGQGGELNAQNNPNAGQNIGPPVEPEEEYGWNPGPDGDNAVSDEHLDDDDEVDDDVFVGKNNAVNWIAGPDGTNYKNLSFDGLVHEASNYITEINRDQRTQGVKSEYSHLNTFGAEIVAAHRRKGNYDANKPDAAATEFHKKGKVGTADAKVFAKRNRDVQQKDSDAKRAPAPAKKKDKDEPQPYDKPPINNKNSTNDYIHRGWNDEPEDDDTQNINTEPGAETLVQNMLDDTGGPIEKDAAAAIRKVGDETRQEVIDDLEKQANGLGREAEKAARIKADLQQLPQRLKDKEVVKTMNSGLQQIVKDKGFSLDVTGMRRYGDGTFGSAYITPDNNSIIKYGKLGRNEMDAIYALQDSPYFPKLLNGEYEEPFTSYSSVENNLRNNPNQARPPGQSRYNIPAEVTGGIDVETAYGKIAMTTAKGRRAASLDLQSDPERRTSIAKKIWEGRAAMHMAGFSHNDMHGNNIYIDDDGNPTIIDFGLAKNNKLSAFMEALAGFTGNDYQLFRQANFEHLPDEVRTQMSENYEDYIKPVLEEKLFEQGHDVYTKYKDGMIRMGEKSLKEAQELLQFTDEELDDLIGKLYEGVMEEPKSELEQRMDNAYQKRFDDSRQIDIANRIRQRRGFVPISHGDGIVPMSKLDVTQQS